MPANDADQLFSVPTGRPTRRRVLGGAALAAGALAGRRAAAQGVTRLRYAHGAPVTHVWHLWGLQFQHEVEKNTNGKIKVVIYPNAQMGNDPATAAAVRLGSLEMGAVGTALMNWVPQASVTDAPFLFKNRKQCYAALDGAMGDELKRLAALKGFRLLSWHDLGSRCITNSKHPIVAAKDMQSLKMRVPDSKSYIALMQALGASVVATDLSELYLALSQKLADGQDTPPSVVKSLNLNEVQKYVSKTDHVLTSSSAIMNPAVFARLTPQEQDIVSAAVKVATDYVRNYTQNDEAAVYTYLAGKGMQVTYDVDINSFRTACAEVIPKFPDLFPPDLVKLAQSAPA